MMKKILLEKCLFIAILHTKIARLTRALRSILSTFLEDASLKIGSSANFLSQKIASLHLPTEKLLV
jgi:hypothetical protein